MERKAYFFLGPLHRYTVTPLHPCNACNAVTLVTLCNAFSKKYILTNGFRYIIFVASLLQHTTLIYSKSIQYAKH